MPEGDTVWRAAQTLRRALVGEVLVRSDLRVPAHATANLDGRTVSAASFRGRPVVLTFLYTTCQDTCPTTAQQIRGALDRLDSPVPALAVAVDPPNDTPLRARRFLARQGLTGRMSFLLGSRQELAPVWRSFGVQPQEDGLEHSARVVLLDAAGRPAVAWPTDQLTPEGLAHDLSLLSRAAHARAA